MESSKLNSTYEKMYIYEEQTKDNISIKTQLLFTAIFILISTTVYLARFLDFSFKPAIAYAIVLMIFLVVITAAVSTYFNCKAFSGSEFNRMPYAIRIQEYYEEQIQYNIELHKYNAAVDPEDTIPLVDPKIETEEFISRTYMHCATHNALVNETRSRWVFKAFTCFLIACIPLAIASLLFVTFDMDTSSPRKDLAIRDRHVENEISALRAELASQSKSAELANLENRTTILEQALFEKRGPQMSDQKKTSTTEQATKPQPPVKPSAPPSRVMYDDTNGGSSRSSK